MSVSSERITIVRAGVSARNYWRDVWDFRELLFILAWRDILVRYKQTVVGFAWSVLRPLTTVFALTVVFGYLARLPSQDGVPYSILVMTGVLPWTLFSMSLSDMSSSMLNNASIVSKIYFPRILIPLSVLAVNILDFLIAMVLLLVLMLVYGYWPTWRIVFVPAILAVTLFTVSGFGLLLSALNVGYRDFRYIVPFALSLGWFISPIGFSGTIVPERWRFIYSLNPAVAPIEGFRWCIIGTADAINWPSIVSSITLSALMLVIGIWYFRHYERTFADVI
jgi:lipopolysaccharide transport system permease protein